MSLIRFISSALAIAIPIAFAIDYITEEAKPRLSPRGREVELRNVAISSGFGWGLIRVPGYLQHSLDASSGKMGLLLTESPSLEDLRPDAQRSIALTFGGDLFNFNDGKRLSEILSDTQASNQFVVLSGIWQPKTSANSRPQLIVATMEQISERDYKARLSAERKLETETKARLDKARPRPNINDTLPMLAK